MDNSLKHLSRLDLLELMVKLREENDALAMENGALAAENIRLNQALSTKPVMSRAAKVGSIAELALQANGFFEAAQHAADDYLREIKHMRDQVAARTAAQMPAGSGQAAASQGNAAMQNAQTAAQAAAQATAIVDRANSQAERTLANARSQSEAMLADARMKSETMLADATRQARSIVSRANHQADAVIQAAQADARQQAARIEEQRKLASEASAASNTSQTPRVSVKDDRYNSSVSDELVRGRHARPAEGRQ